MGAAHPGDRIIVQPGPVGGRVRDGEVLEARGPGGTPPYLVRWSDTGRISLLFPGPDAVVHDGTSRAASAPVLTEGAERRWATGQQP
ncbi:hypothetical protein ATJ97_2687 [Georgenia soli]|uniref:DUF1918 domain-containing protein n=2 Tax=Georgenia soli TaxID=638953 RepID=A0A2A9ENI9_9MICO|nr:hypothetical protein ATJ97_2687 [Georgenia soli]